MPKLTNSMGEFAIRIIFDRKKIARRDASKVAPITIEVREVGTNKKVPLDTHVKIKASEYSKNYGFTIKNRPDARELKIEVLKIYNRVEEFINSPQCLSLEDFRTWKNKGATPKTTFIDFFKFYMDLHHHSYATREHYQSLLTRLEQFGKIIEFKDLTYSNIADFDSFLRKTITSQPVLHKRHSAMKRIIEDARNRKLIDVNPYTKFHFAKGKSKESIFLTEEEIKRIIDHNTNNSSMMKTKDLLLFQCLTGLSFKDVEEFNKNYLIRDDDGYEYIYATRHKTDIYFKVPVNYLIKSIIEKYNYNLSILSLPKYNTYLKVLSAHLKIDKTITSYTGRHSLGRLLANKGMNAYMIAIILGHADTRQTLRYVHMAERTATMAMSKIIDTF